MPRPAIHQHTSRHRGTRAADGSNASTADYPVWCSYRELSSGKASYTFSFSDAGSVGSSTGWDDFQDGSGMGDDWEVEGLGDNGARGAASMIVLQ